jgi:hypothetical protein
MRRITSEDESPLETLTPDPEPRNLNVVIEMPQEPQQVTDSILTCD